MCVLCSSTTYKLDGRKLLSPEASLKLKLRIIFFDHCLQVVYFGSRKCKRSVNLKVAFFLRVILSRTYFLRISSINYLLLDYTNNLKVQIQFFVAQIRNQTLNTILASCQIRISLRNVQHSLKEQAANYAS